MSQNAPQPQTAGFPEGSKEWSEVDEKYKDLLNEYPPPVESPIPLSYYKDLAYRLIKGKDKSGETEGYEESSKILLLHELNAFN